MNYYTNKCIITLFDIKYFYDHTDNNAKSSHLPLLIVIKNMLYSLLKHSSSCGHCIYLLRLTLIHCIAYSMISKTKSTCYLYGKIVRVKWNSSSFSLEIFTKKEIIIPSEVLLFSHFYWNYQNFTVRIITLVPCSFMKYAVCLWKNCTVPFSRKLSPLESVLCRMVNTPTIPFCLEKVHSSIWQKKFSLVFPCKWKALN